MKRTAALLPVFAGIMWGSAGIFVRTLTGFGMDRITIISTRMIVAVPLLLILLLITDKRRLRIRLKDLWIFAGCGLIGILGLNLFYNESVGVLSLSLAAILLSTAPFFALFFSRLIFHEKITAWKIFCLVMAIAGCILAGGILESGGGKWSSSGIAMGLAAAVFFALYGIFSRFGTNRGYSTFTILFYSMLMICIVLLPATDFSCFGKFIAEAPLANSGFAFIHSLFTSVLPYLLYTISLIYMENGRVAILSGGAEPASAFVFGILFYSEIPTALNLLGLALTIAALTLMCIDPHAKAEPGPLESLQKK